MNWSALRLVNLTEHDVVVYGAADQVLLHLPVSGAVARVSERRHGRPPIPSTAGPIPAFVVGYAEQVDGLPDPEPGLVYVVSRITAAACPRADVLFPLDEVRNPRGHIIGCRALGQFKDGEPRAAGG